MPWCADGLFAEGAGEAEEAMGRVREHITGEIYFQASFVCSTFVLRLAARPRRSGRGSVAEASSWQTSLTRGARGY